MVERSFMSILEAALKGKYSIDVKGASDQQIYYTLIDLVKEEAKKKESLDGKKKLYYI